MLKENGPLSSRQIFEKLDIGIKYRTLVARLSLFKRKGVLTAERGLNPLYDPDKKNSPLQVLLYSVADGSSPPKLGAHGIKSLGKISPKTAAKYKEALEKNGYTVTKNA